MVTSIRADSRARSKRRELGAVTTSVVSTGNSPGRRPRFVSFQRHGDASLDRRADRAPVACGRGHGDARGTGPTTSRSPWRYVLVVVVVGFAAFWMWALFFASKEAINRFDDRAWAAQAEQICARADDERDALIDLREVDGDDPAMLAERAAIVDRATDVLDRMLDDVVAVLPDDPKGRELVPRWEADYRAYLADRREFTERLRGARTSAFTETAVDGIPISDKLEVFAGDNEMPSCAPAARPADHSSLTTTAGLPATMQLSGSSPRTTLLAATTTWRPMVAPGRTTVPWPSHDPSPMRTGRSGWTCTEIGRSRSS